MRIAIVDDISEERTLLRNRLNSQFSRRNVHVDIFEYENGETFLSAAKDCPFTVVPLVNVCVEPAHRSSQRNI